MNASHKIAMTGVGRLIFLVLACSCQKADATIYYAATNGADSNNGTSTSTPFRTVQHAVDVLAPGDSLQVAAGTYREYVLLSKSGNATNPVFIMGASDAASVIKGSEVVTNWIAYTNAIWKIEDWPQNVQQVFEDGRVLEQVGWPNVFIRDVVPYVYTPSRDTLARMTNGTFFYDLTNRVLYVWCSDNLAPTAASFRPNDALCLHQQHEFYALRGVHLLAGRLVRRAAG
jgi:hypothetical protein